MNDTGGGVTAIHDVPGDITRIGFHWMLLFFLSVTRRGLLFVLHTECLGGHGFSLSRIFELFLHTECRGIIFFITNYRIIEYLSHGMSRRSRIFFVPRLVLGPTDRREVIREFFLHTDCRGIIFFITNYRIIECLSHGMSRRSRIFSCHETCPWTH